MNRTLSREELHAYKRQLMASVAKKRSLAEPMDWSWSTPILTDAMITRAEQGDSGTVFYQAQVILVKQVGMRLSRKAILKLFEYGTVDTSNRYQPMANSAGRNSSSALYQIAFHAFIMGFLEHTVLMSQPGAGERYDVPSIFELAADLMLSWIKEELTVPEMFQGMALETTYLDYFPYTHVHAWDKVHKAMHALPGVVLSRPARVSLTRLVWEWMRASRLYGREHEVELMSQIDLYGRIEQQVGGQELEICELFEIRDLYYRKQVLENKRRSARNDEEFVSMAPILGVLGSAIPRQQMLTHPDAHAVHKVYGQRIELDGVELEFLDTDPDRIQWRG